MDEMKEVVLPTGRKLSIGAAPFKDARRLYQAVGGEFLKIEIDPEEEITNLIKNALCLGFGSLEIERALEPCLKRCLYNGAKITDATFEPLEAREDYLDICVEVARENIRPFTKSLFAQFKGVSAVLGKVLQSASSLTQRGLSPTSASAPQATGT